ncbi:hypothetical protein D1BOALGB6SA_6780 [Olavius sp. associated proteobacterium Delta 1]|nr:hypothetical protein D1BOALGB6SA_6780 [Olavius sp. associated proteobacterium Delta 1]
MTAIVYIRRLTALLLSSLVLLMLLGCGGGGGNSAASYSSSLDLTLTTADEAFNSRQIRSVSTARAQTGDPDFVTLIEITVRADDIDPPISESFTLTGSEPTVTVALLVPAGNDRAITALLYNEDGVPIFEGQTTVDLLARVEQVTIVLQSLLATFAYAGNNVSDNVSGFSINSSTGALSATSGSPFSDSGVASADIRALTADPFGSYLYVANGIDGSVSGFSINSSTGALSAISGSPFSDTSPPSDFPVALAVDPSGSFVYVLNGSVFGTVSGFSVNSGTGALTTISGSPFSDSGVASPDAVALAADPLERFLYVANRSDDSVSGFNLNSSTGALTVISGSPFVDPWASFPGIHAVAMDPSGSFVYTANFSSGDISGFGINSSTGALTAISGSPFSDPAPTSPDPIALAAHPSENFLYVVNSGDDSVSGFSINSSTGALTVISGSPFATTGTGPVALAVDPSGSFVYVTDSPNNISAFEIQDSDGALVSIPGFSLIPPTEEGAASIATTFTFP